LKSKDEAYLAFLSFKAQRELQEDVKIKMLRTDNGGEFANEEFIETCNELGIIHQFTNPYTPQQNGVVERANRTIMDSVRVMLKESGLSACFLG